jgi:hypothetical protein
MGDSRCNLVWRNASSSSSGSILWYGSVLHHTWYTTSCTGVVGVKDLLAAESMSQSSGPWEAIINQQISRFKVSAFLTFDELVSFEKRKCSPPPSVRWHPGISMIPCCRTAPMCALLSIERISPHPIHAELDRPYGSDQGDSVPWWSSQKACLRSIFVFSPWRYPAHILMCASLCSCFFSWKLLGSW